jgi:hypothetical protein
MSVTPEQLILRPGDCPRCGKFKQPAHLMCGPCWYRVPAQLRADVYSALGAFGAGIITLADLRLVQQAAINGAGVLQPGEG